MLLKKGNFGRRFKLNSTKKKFTREDDPTFYWIRFLGDSTMLNEITDVEIMQVYWLHCSNCCYLRTNRCSASFYVWKKTNDEWQLEVQTHKNPRSANCLYGI